MNRLIDAATWQPSNVNECVQPKLSELKREIYLFTTTDNFDESLIVDYLDRLYEATVNSIIKSNQQASGQQQQQQEQNQQQSGASAAAAAASKSKSSLPTRSPPSPLASSPAASSSSLTHSSNSAGGGGGDGVNTPGGSTVNMNSLRSIHDVSTVIDAMFLLINAQVNFWRFFLLSR